MYSCLLLRWHCVPAFLSVRRDAFPGLGVASCKCIRQWSTAFPLQRAFWTTPRRPSSGSSGASSVNSTGTISSELPSRRRLPTRITLRLFVLYGSSVFSNGRVCCTNRQLCWAKLPRSTSQKWNSISLPTSRVVHSARLQHASCVRGKAIPIPQWRGFQGEARARLHRVLVRYQNSSVSRSHARATPPNTQSTVSRWFRSVYEGKCNDSCGYA